jgi:hypothetical protein
MATTQKALRFSSDLKDQLKFLLPKTWVITESFDSSGNPVVTYQQDSSWAAGEQKFVVRFIPRPLLAEAKNALGIAQDVFAQHVVQIVMEASATAGLPVVLAKFYALVLAVASHKGTRLEVFLSANTVDPSIAAITGNPTVAIEPDIYNGLTNSQ